MKWSAYLAIAGILFSASAARASVEIIGNTSTSTDHLDDFTGLVDYNSTTDILSVTLTDTVSPSGNLITGFAFDAPKGYTATLIGNPDSFKNLVNPSAAPFGTFTSGAALGGDWLGGGNPNSGIALDDTETFTFKVTGTSPNLLTTQNFLPGDFAVRFRGGNDSDKILSETPYSSSVPLPASVWSGAITLLTFGACGVLKAKKKQVA